jgi:hypothetical protein
MDVAHGFQDNLGIFILCEKQIVRAAKSERRQLQRAQSLRHRFYGILQILAIVQIIL